MRSHWATTTAAACLATGALLGSPAATARTPPRRTQPAMLVLTEGQIGLALRSTGTVATRIALAVLSDSSHRCMIPDDPAAAYLLSFGAAPGAALLDPAHPGLIVTLATRPAAMGAAGDAGTADASALGQAAPGGTARKDGAAAPEPAPDSTIQVSVGGRRFIGIGSMDPEYRLAVTLSADGRRGSFAARHLVDASAGGAVDVTGTWRCPAAVPVPAAGLAALAADPASRAPGTPTAPGPEPARAKSPPTDAAADAAPPDVASASQPPAPQAPVPGDPAMLDATREETHALPPDAATAAPAPASSHAATSLGRATATLTAPHHPGRATPRHAGTRMPGCTSMATLDGVSAALQAGPFGRRQGLAIMQFRNVVTDGATDRKVDCHADVLLSDASLHHAEYGLRSARRGTRLHIEVARDRQGTHPTNDLPPPPPKPTPRSVPEPATPGSPAPAT